MTRKEKNNVILKFILVSINIKIFNKIKTIMFRVKDRIAILIVNYNRYIIYIVRKLKWQRI
jgi:hypothetical protein